MLSLLLAAYVPIHVTCTNCNGVGYFEVECPRCAGKGLVDPPRSTKTYTRGAVDRSLIKLPCPACVKGLSSKDKKGTGKKKVSCKVCKGLKKIKKQP